MGVPLIDFTEMVDPEKPVHSEEKVSEENDKNKSLRLKFLENVLLNEYETTLGFVSKLVWPIVTLALVCLLYAEISNFIIQVSSNFSRTNKINIAGVEIEYTSAFGPSDLEAYEVIKTLSREDLIRVIDLSGAPINMRASTFEGRYQTEILGLIEADLVTVETIESSSPEEENRVVVTPTELGERVYDELRNILINFLNSIPEDVDKL